MTLKDTQNKMSCRRPLLLLLPSSWVKREFVIVSFSSCFLGLVCRVPLIISQIEWRGGWLG